MDGSDGQTMLRQYGSSGGRFALQPARSDDRPVHVGVVLDQNILGPFLGSQHVLEDLEHRGRRCLLGRTASDARDEHDARHAEDARSLDDVVVANVVHALAVLDGIGALSHGGNGGIAAVHGTLDGLVVEGVASGDGDALDGGQFGGRFVTTDQGHDLRAGVNEFVDNGPSDSSRTSGHEHLFVLRTICCHHAEVGRECMLTMTLGGVGNRNEI
mmetsp:Transcript_6746/g.14748  ORF Transcript_6746/g.14748 Transcript_6746/m.14748 type:complete len:214 (+) Transcript_6746:269-910(+)